MVSNAEGTSTPHLGLEVLFGYPKSKKYGLLGPLGQATTQDSGAP